MLVLCCKHRVNDAVQKLEKTCFRRRCHKSTRQCVLCQDAPAPSPHPATRLQTLHTHIACHLSHLHIVNTVLRVACGQRFPRLRGPLLHSDGFVNGCCCARQQRPATGTGFRFSHEERRGQVQHANDTCWQCVRRWNPGSLHSCSLRPTPCGVL